MAWTSLPILILIFVIETCYCGQRLLSNMSWSDTINKEYRLKIVTVSSDKNDDGLLRFLRSCKVFNLDVEVFGLEGEWLHEDIKAEHGGGMKLDLLRKSLEKYKNDEKLILMFTDSYQTIFTAGKKEILKKFKETGAKILISAEDYCWHDRSLKTRYLVRQGEGYRYLCSGGIIGYAPSVYTILTILTVRPADDYQLYYRHIFLDDRKTYNIKWDRRASLFQNLNGFEGNVELKFDGPNVRIINSGFHSVPVVIHGNGPSVLLLNQLANYAPKAWTHRDGCIACREDTINLESMPREDWPKVLIGLFINGLTPFVDRFLRRIADLDYPKDRIHIFIHNKVTDHINDVEEWKKEYKGEYMSIYYEGPSSALSDQQARNIGIHHCKKVKGDYYFSVDAEVTLTNWMTLQILIEQNKSFIAPMVSYFNERWRANFWGDITEDNEYARSFDYLNITKNLQRGVWNVAYVSDVYLLKASVIQKISITPFHSKKHDAYIQFCSHLRRKGIFMHVTNMEHYGHLKSVETYHPERKHNDLYQLFDNILDWEDKYLHKDFTIDIKREQVEQPCQDVYSIPVFSKLFTKHLREECEHFGQWFLDERITGGYENVATSALQKIGFEKHWLSMLKQYFRPMTDVLFPGYVSKAEGSMNVVVKLWSTMREAIPLFNDTSTITINVALNERGVDYQGGGERYVRYNCSTLGTREGWTLIHPGRLTHQHEYVKPSRGTRYTMISFVDP